MCIQSNTKVQYDNNSYNNLEKLVYLIINNLGKLCIY